MSSSQVLNAAGSDNDQNQNRGSIKSVTASGNVSNINSNGGQRSSENNRSSSNSQNMNSTTSSTTEGFSWSPEMGPPKIGHRLWFRTDEEGTFFKLHKVKSVEPYVLEPVVGGAGTTITLNELHAKGQKDLDLKDVFPRQDRNTLVSTAMESMTDFNSGGILRSFIAGRVFDRSCSGLIFHKVDPSRRHLLSLNPFDEFPIYHDKFAQKYLEAGCEGKCELLPPHIFELPSKALGSDLKDSAIVIIGDTMSGKSENLMRILQVMQLQDRAKFGEIFTAAMKLLRPFITTSIKNPNYDAKLAQENSANANAVVNGGGNDSINTNDNNANIASYNGLPNNPLLPFTESGQTRATIRWDFHCGAGGQGQPIQNKPTDNDPDADPKGNGGYSRILAVKLALINLETSALFPPQDGSSTNFKVFYEWIESASFLNPIKRERLLPGWSNRFTSIRLKYGAKIASQNQSQTDNSDAPINSNTEDLYSKAHAEEINATFDAAQLLGLPLDEYLGVLDVILRLKTLEFDSVPMNGNEGSGGNINIVLSQKSQLQYSEMIENIKKISWVLECDPETFRQFLVKKGENLKCTVEAISARRDRLMLYLYNALVQSLVSHINKKFNEVLNLRPNDNDDDPTTTFPLTLAKSRPEGEHQIMIVMPAMGNSSTAVLPHDDCESFGKNLITSSIMNYLPEWLNLGNNLHPAVCSSADAHRSTCTFLSQLPGEMWRSQLPNPKLGVRVQGNPRSMGVNTAADRGILEIDCTYWARNDEKLQTLWISPKWRREADLLNSRNMSVINPGKATGPMASSATNLDRVLRYEMNESWVNWLYLDSSWMDELISGVCQTTHSVLVSNMLYQLSGRINRVGLLSRQVDNMMECFSLRSKSVRVNICIAQNNSGYKTDFDLDLVQKQLRMFLQDLLLARNLHNRDLTETVDLGVNYPGSLGGSGPLTGGQAQIDALKSNPDIVLDIDLETVFKPSNISEIELVKSIGIDTSRIAPLRLNRNMSVGGPGSGIGGAASVITNPNNRNNYVGQVFAGNASASALEGMINEQINRSGGNNNLSNTNDTVLNNIQSTIAMGVNTNAMSQGGADYSTSDYIPPQKEIARSRQELLRSAVEQNEAASRIMVSLDGVSDSNRVVIENAMAALLLDTPRIDAALGGASGFPLSPNSGAKPDDNNMPIQTVQYSEPGVGGRAAGQYRAILSQASGAETEIFRRMQTNERHRNFIANQKADVFDSISMNDTLTTKKRIEQLWPLFDSNFVKFVLLWLESHACTVDLEISPLQRTTGEALARVDEMIALEASINGGSGNASMSYLGKSDAAKSIGFRAVGGLPVMSPRDKAVANGAGGGSGNTISPGNNLVALGQPLGSSFNEQLRINLPRDFDFLPYHEREMILQRQGVRDERILKNPRTESLVKANKLGRDTQGRGPYELFTQSVFEKNNNNNDGSDGGAGGYYGTSNSEFNFVKKVGAAAPDGGNPNQEWERLEERDISDKDLDGASYPNSSYVSAVALHQALTSMSLELRSCQEQLAKSRMIQATSGNNSGGNGGLSDGSIGSIRGSQHKILLELRQERDYWRTECNLLWDQIKSLQVENSSWEKEFRSQNANNNNNSSTTMGGGTGRSGSRDLHLLVRQMQAPKQPQSREQLTLEQSRQLLNDLRVLVHEKKPVG